MTGGHLTCLTESTTPRSSARITRSRNSFTPAMPPESAPSVQQLRHSPGSLAQQFPAIIPITLYVLTRCQNWRKLFRQLSKSDQKISKQPKRPFDFQYREQPVTQRDTFVATASNHLRRFFIHVTPRQMTDMAWSKSSKIFSASRSPRFPYFSRTCGPIRSLRTYLSWMPLFFFMLARKGEQDR